MGTKVKQPAKPEGMPETVKVLRAFKPGDIVFIEVDKPLHRDAMTSIYHQFKKLIPEIKVVVLQHGMKVAARADLEEQPITSEPK